jgi:hypothetical protein
MTSVYPAHAPRQLQLPASTTAGMDPILLNLPISEASGKSLVIIPDWRLLHSKDCVQELM